jgi:hypothetical protein
MGCRSSKVEEDVDLAAGWGLEEDWELKEEHSCTACGHAFTKKEFCGGKLDFLICTVCSTLYSRDNQRSTATVMPFSNSMEESVMAKIDHANARRIVSMLSRKYASRLEEEQLVDMVEDVMDAVEELKQKDGQFLNADDKETLTEVLQAQIINACFQAEQGGAVSTGWAEQDSRLGQQQGGNKKLKNAVTTTRVKNLIRQASSIHMQSPQVQIRHLTRNVAAALGNQAGGFRGDMSPAITNAIARTIMPHRSRVRVTATPQGFSTKRGINRASFTCSNEVASNRGAGGRVLSDPAGKF